MEETANSNCEASNKKCTKCKCYRYPKEFLNEKGRELKQCIKCRSYANKYRLEIKKNIVINKKPKQMFEKGIGSQQQCFDKGDKTGHNCFIAYQQKLGGKWSNTYTSFNDIQEFLDYQETIKSEEKRFHEIIRGSCPEYYDLDFKLDNWVGDTVNQKIDNVIDEFIRVRNEFSYMNTVNNMTYKKHDLIVLESCGASKLSLHIIIRPELNKRSKRYFSNCKQQKTFAKLFSNFLENQDTKIVLDLSVYNSNSLMRLKDSHKTDEVDRKFKAYTKNIQDPKLFFCSYVGEEKGDFPLEIDIEKRIHHPLEGNEAQLSDNEQKILFDNLAIKRWDDYDTCLSLIWLGKKFNMTDADIHLYCSKSEKYTFNWVQSTIDRRREDCPFNIGTLLYYLKQDVNAEVFKRIVPANTESTYQVIKKKNSSRRTQEEKDYLENVNNLIIKRQIDSLFAYNENAYIKIKIIPNNIPFVQDITFPKNFRCVGIHAGLGLGKTSSLVRLVKSMPEDAKVLILSPRISFSTNICAEYNRALDENRQFHCYITYKKNGTRLSQLKFQNKIVISMESLHYLEDFTPDLLIIDECNANLISSCSTETNGKNLDNNIYEFNRLLHNSKKVVVADAFLGSKVCNFFTDIKIPLFVYKYLVKPKPLKAIFLNPLDKDVKKAMKQHLSPEEYQIKKCQADSYYIKIKELLQQGKKVYAFISSRKKLEFLESELKNTSFKGEFYSGVSQNEVPDDLDKEWDKKDIVGTTSTITVGISHTSNHFDTKVIYFQASSNNYISDAIQSHFRVRKIKEDHIYVEMEEPSIFVNCPVNTKNFDDSLDHRNKWFNNAYGGFSQLDPYMRNLLSHNHLEHSLSKQVPTKMMYKYLEECNYKICIDKSQNALELRNEEKESKNNLDIIISDDEEKKVDIIKELVDNFPNAPRIVELEKEKMKRKLSASERIEIDRFWFFNMYTGGTPAGYRDTNISTVALAYQIWKYQFSGSKVIRSMRLEKKVLEGKITIKELAEEKWSKTQFSELQNKEILKIERIIYVCKKLGLKHCNDTETEIPQEKMNEFYTEAKHEYDSIQKDMDIQDKRVKKGSATEKQFAGLCKSVFTASDHSMCNLEVIKESKVRKNGKQVRVRSYGLVPNKELEKEIKTFNNDLENKEHIINEDDIKNCPLNMYNNLVTSGKDISLLQDK